MKVDARSRRPMRVVVAGEFNSGKTAFVNALAGAPVLAPSAVSHTVHPTVVSFAAKPSLSAETIDRKRIAMTWDGIAGGASGFIRRVHVGAPLQRLQRLKVVDTPGIGFADEDEQTRGLRECHAADTIVWCTPAMQAWKASEERAWLALPQRLHARGLLAVTFMDAIVSPADRDRLMQRLHLEAGSYFRAIGTSAECVELVLANGGMSPSYQDRTLTTPTGPAA